MFEPCDAHRNVREHSNDEATEAGPNGIGGAALLPDHGHALDSHRDNHHREQRNRQSRVNAERVRDEADQQHQHHGDDQDGGQTRHQQQPQSFEQEADTQSE